MLCKEEILKVIVSTQFEKSTAFEKCNLHYFVQNVYIK